MGSTLSLLPFPRTIKLVEGIKTITNTGFIALDVPQPPDLLFTAQQAQQALTDYAGVSWEIAGGNNPSAAPLVCGRSGVSLVRHCEANVAIS